MPSDWSSVELRHLATLSAIGRERSFSRAAEALGYTQSAVSQQVARLERLVGQRLVERPGGPRPVSLTPAGQALARHADAVVGRIATAAADVRAIADGSAGTLTIGTFQSASARLLPGILGAHAREWPAVSVRLAEDDDDQALLAMLESGDLDLAFVVFPVPREPFETVEVLADPYVIAVSPDSPLARASGPVEPAELLGLPLVTYGRMRDVHGVENRLGRPELADQVRFRSHSNEALVAMAAEGLGVAVLTDLSVSPHRDDVVVRPLLGVAPRVIGLAWHRDRHRSAALESFVESALRQGRTHSP